MTQITLRNYLQATEDAITAGNTDEALARCQRLMSQFPESLEVQRLLGEVYLAHGQLEESQQMLDWVLTNDPENVIAYCDRALMSERASDIETALDCYQQAYELSRGNSHIRLEFNRLSEHSGQPGFMYSRAGLARLYMRGDLLSQAILEWDAVLAAYPERLDARIGLLETYWHIGSLDHAEQLARQIIRDVPGCLKALLLLAYIVSLGDMREAQEHLKTAESLDPEFLMARQFFADTMARQPNNPFFKLILKNPPLIDENVFTTSSPSEAEKPFDLTLLSSQANNLEVWDSTQTLPRPDRNLSQPIQTQAAEDDTPFSSSQPENITLVNDPLHILANQGTSQPTHTPQLDKEPTLVLADGWNTFSEQERAKDEFQFDWSVSDEPFVTASQSQPAKPEPSFYGNTHLSAAPVYELSEEDTDSAPTPPSWLSMLTQSETKKPIGTPPAANTITAPSLPPAANPVGTAFMPSEKSDHPSNPVDAPSTPPTSTPNTIGAAFMPPTASQPLPTLDIDENDEPFSFGPEWLKSLGAASWHGFTTDNDFSTHAPAPQQEQPSFQETASELPPDQPLESPQIELVEDSWQEQLQQTQPVDDPWQVPAAEAEPQPTFDQQDQSPQTEFSFEQWQESDIAPAQDTPLLSPIPALSEQPSLSSALAQLGPFVEHYTPTTYDQPAAQPLQAQTPATPAAAEPILAALHNTPTPVPATTSVPRTTQPLPPQSAPTPSPVLAQAPEATQSLPSLHADRPTQQSGNPPASIQPPTTGPNSAPAAPARYINEPFDLELETTMRRPAIKPSAFSSQRPASPHSQAHPLYKERTISRPAAASGTGEINYRNQLIQGYQHQLVGDYDEAMQAYRVIIKNAPELLGEVVSNVRALLKLAPKYSPGYRVLGDAYMRQGEYLQAMEAYNKALAMAKKSTR